ncbi:MAG: hypothetical protein IK125_04250 [Lachnospiraceae bacterium]|nr:hypothetical protein [Lachnospiraceae bacterium]
MMEDRIPDPVYMERLVLAKERIAELRDETKDAKEPLLRYFHALFSLLALTEDSKFYQAFGEDFEDSFADSDASSPESALPENCEQALRLLMRECADCRTLYNTADWIETNEGIFDESGQLIYFELALEVYSYVSEILEESPNAAHRVSGDVILEMIADMHRTYDTEYIEHRYNTIFQKPDASFVEYETDAGDLWEQFCEDPEMFYCGLPFDQQAHEHVMQKIAEHPEENRYADVIAYLMDNASGQTVGFNGNVLKLPFFLKALSEMGTVPFRLSFYAVEYHPALFLQGYGGLYAKLSDAFIRQRRNDAQFMQKYLPVVRIRRQIQNTEDRRKQGIETLHIVKL